MRYEFDAPSHHLLVIGDDEYHGGDIVELDESAAAGFSSLKPVGEEYDEPSSSSGDGSDGISDTAPPGSDENPIAVRTSSR